MAANVSRFPSSTPGWSNGLTPYHTPANPVASCMNMISSPNTSSSRRGTSSVAFIRPIRARAADVASCSARSRSPIE